MRIVFGNDGGIVHVCSSIRRGFREAPGNRFEMPIQDLRIDWPDEAYQIATIDDDCYQAKTILSSSLFLQSGSSMFRLRSVDPLVIDKFSGEE